MKQWIALLFILGIEKSWSADNPKDVYANNHALKTLIGKKTFDAQKEFLDALAASPKNSVLQFNLAITLEVNNDKERAVKIYESLARNDANPELRFLAFVNAARVYGENQEFDKALHLYQQALELQPTSKEVKTNIELLKIGRAHV